MTTSISCGACGAALVAADRFCAGCGAAVAEPVAPAASVEPASEAALRPGAFVPQDAPPSLKPSFGLSANPSFGAGASERMRGEHLRRARRWLMAVAIMTAGAGVLFSSMLPAEMESAKRMILVTNLVLGAFYLGMWAWAKKNLLGATATALTVFVAVIVINAAMDPITLTQGILIKILFTGALISSVREALADRADRAGHAGGSGRSDQALP